jgi:inner membrane protein YidH
MPPGLHCTCAITTFGIPGWTMTQSATTARRSADRVATAVEQVGDSADRRTVLAADRTIFAAERTYAAWVRTGLAALAAGVGAKAALGEIMSELIVLIADSALVVFSAFCFAAAVWRELFPGAPPPRPDVRKIPPWLLIAMNGFLGIVSAAALAGIWLARTPGH